ncbi:MAG: hypothetical protein KKB90_13560 [Actinobacteria bacterium]|nr:hypothetical protein [Actinomycetota bacterium]MCG2818408.1 hypothetical protein [Actinomycetes bacterium]MBU4178814.1 hypothetical protein [Actinomycetota bacterium]MBU4219966.1 hypothetical protein [Actinomycetota bacterium]MBU4358312.1 hypothetical protein [Actinomycetota bacterium]
MAKKKPAVETIDLLVKMFQEYPGSVVVERLRDGACLEATVDGQEFGLEKTDGVLMISEGAPVSPDISVELNREACDYLAGSETPDDVITRTRECINGTHDDCTMTYSIDAGPPRMLLKGYLDFARKMGLL